MSERTAIPAFIISIRLSPLFKYEKTPLQRLMIHPSDANTLNNLTRKGD